MPTPQRPRPILARGSWTETARIAAILRTETVGGALVLAATVIALMVRLAGRRVVP